MLSTKTPYAVMGSTIKMKVGFKAMHDDGTKVKALVANMNVTKSERQLFKREIE